MQNLREVACGAWVAGSGTSFAWAGEGWNLTHKSADFGDYFGGWFVVGFTMVYHITMKHGKMRLKHLVRPSVRQETGHCGACEACGHRQTSGPPELNDFVVASSQSAGGIMAGERGSVGSALDSANIYIYTWHHITSHSINSITEHHITAYSVDSGTLLTFRAASGSTIILISTNRTRYCNKSVRYWGLLYYEYSHDWLKGIKAVLEIFRAGL